MLRDAEERDAPNGSNSPSGKFQRLLPWRRPPRRSNPPGVMLAAVVALAALPFNAGSDSPGDDTPPD